MTLEQRLTNLESRFEALQAAFIQAQRNQIPITAKADSTVSLSQQIEEITPYKETKTAYIDDMEITFDNVPSGNLTVFFDGDYEVERIGDKVVISFEPLNRVIDITIMVQ